MNKLLCYAHFDEYGKVQPFVFHFLHSMIPLGTELVFISNSPISDSDNAKLSTICSRVIINKNAGYDFSMWKTALESCHTSDYNEIILANSSILGPVFPMKDVFSRMEQLECDFWGITTGYLVQRHIQSYFLVFRKNVILSQSFRMFWDSVLPYSNKRQIINSYEVGLTQWLIESGFKPGVYISLEQLRRHCRDAGRRLRKTDNSCVKHAEELLSAGSPFIKREAVRNGVIDLNQVLTRLQNNPPKELFDEHSEEKKYLCPLCKSSSRVRIRNTPDFHNPFDIEGYTYFKCDNRKCGVVWTKQRINTPSLAVSPPVGASAIAVLPQSLLSVLQQRKPGRILEIGSGSDELAEFCHKYGWQVTVSKHDICSPNMPDSDKPEESHKTDTFDVILIVNDSGYLANPSDTLKYCNRVLKQGGVIYIKTPNGDSIQLTLYRKYWYGINAPRSLMIHNRKSLAALLSEANLEGKIINSTINSGNYAIRSLEARMNRWVSDAFEPNKLQQYVICLVRTLNSTMQMFARNSGDEYIVIASKK